MSLAVEDRIVQHDIVQNDVSGSRPKSPNFVHFRRILASSPDGQLIAALLRDCTVIVADFTGNLHHTILVGNRINCMTISPDKKCLATSDCHGIHLFDLRTGRLQRSLKTGRYGRTIAFSPDGQLLASINRQEITLELPCPEKASGPVHGRTCRYN